MEEHEELGFASKKILGQFIKEVKNAGAFAKGLGQKKENNIIKEVTLPLKDELKSLDSLQKAKTVAGIIQLAVTPDLNVWDKLTKEGKSEKVLSVFNAQNLMSMSQKKIFIPQTADNNPTLGLQRDTAAALKRGDEKDVVVVPPRTEDRIKNTIRTTLSAVEEKARQSGKAYSKEIKPGRQTNNGITN